MKKSLLALTVLAMISSSANAMYVIGDPAGAWGPSKGVEMTEKDGAWEWTGTIEANKYFAFATELMDDDKDWNTFNSTYRLAPEVTNTQANPGEYNLVHQDASFKGCGAKCTYKITKDGDTYKLTVVALGEVPEEPKIETMGVVGELNSWNGDEPMTELSEDLWTATIADLTGSFKFRANGSWDISFGYPDKVMEITEDGYLPVVKDGKDFSVKDAKNITFILDIKNLTVYTKFNSTKATKYSVRGLLDDWPWDAAACFYETEEKGVYSMTLSSIKKGTEFKISDPSWEAQYTSEKTNMVAGEVYDLVANEGTSKNMAFGADYDNLTLTLDTNKNTLKGSTSSESGISEIATNNGEAIYFNLQGAKVEKDTKGVLIRVSAGKAEKVIVK